MEPKIHPFFVILILHPHVIVFWTFNIFYQQRPFDTKNEVEHFRYRFIRIFLKKRIACLNLYY